MEHTERTRRYVLVVATVTAFVTPFMGSSVNVAVPAIGRDLHLDAVALNWVVTSYLLTTAVFLLPFGRAADLYGRKRVFQVGIAVYGFVSLLCGIAPTGAVLIACRFAQGAGAAMVFGTSLAMLTSVYPPGDRGRVLGLNVAAVYTGLSTGPVVGGFLTDHLSWRAIFLLNSVLGAVVLLTGLYGLRALPKDARPGRLDWPGALLYATGLAGLMYGVAAVNSSPLARYILAAGALLMAGFVYREPRTEDPLLDLSLFRNPVFAFSNLAALIHYSATFGLGFLLSLYLQVIQGLDAQSAGLILLSQPVLMALVSPAAGRLSDRFEPRTIASAGMALTFVGLLLFALLRPETPLPAVAAILVVIGLGLGLFSSPNTNAIMSSVERSRYGVASAALGTVRLVGQASSMALVTFFFALNLHGRPVTPEVAPLLMRSLHITFTCFAILCAAGIFASLVRGRLRPETPAGGR